MVGEERPWGRWLILEEAPRYKVKRIEVEVGQGLSLQYHHHRSDHWVVVQGQATVRVGDQTLFLCPGESTFVPQTAIHRIENWGSERLVVIEIQTGPYLGEDDIVRLQDDYGRVLPEPEPVPPAR